MQKIRVLLADDHTIVLEGLKKILEPAFELVGTVDNGRDLVDETLKLRPDVIVVDISMPLLNGIEAVRRIKTELNRVKVIFLTMHPDVSYASMAFNIGASGYVLKNSASRELHTAINEVMKGGTYVTPLIAGELMQNLKRGQSDDNAFNAKLTMRQREVLQLLAEGYSAKEIANLLSISSRTVETHKYNMMQTLNLQSTADLVKYAIKEGLTTI